MSVHLDNLFENENENAIERMWLCHTIHEVKFTDLYQIIQRISIKENAGGGIEIEKECEKNNHADFFRSTDNR